MKNLFQKAIITAGIFYSASDLMVRGDIVIGGFLPNNRTGISVERYSDLGVHLGRVGFTNGEEMIDLAINSSGNIYAAGNSVGLGAITQLNAITKTPGEYADPRTIGFGWNGRLFATSGSVFGSGMTGVLEFDITKFDAFSDPFVRNAIPFAGGISGNSPAYLAFDSSLTNSSPFGAGAFYVGSSAPNNASKKTERYRQNITTGAIVKDSTFSLSLSGPLAIKPGDHTLFLASGSAVGRYDQTTGASLGTFLTVPSGQIVKLEFAGDNSVYVMSYLAGATKLYHFDAVGGFLGTTFSYTPDSQSSYSYPMSFALLSTPEPISAAFMMPCLLVLFRCSRAKKCNG